MRIMLLLWAVLLLGGLAFPAFAQGDMLGPAADQGPKVPEDTAPPNLLEQLEQAKPAAPSSVLLPKLPTDPALKGKEKRPYKNYKDIPEEAIEEAVQVSVDCKAEQMMAVYYDCDCYGMRFLEQRLIRGPLVGQDTVKQDIGTECPNLPAIAGSAYQACIGRGLGSFPKKQDPEEYCSCVGNAYAKLYERSGRMIDMRLKIKMETIAALSCTKQESGVPPLVAPIR
ncbi:MAG TPA: hypothetical protein PLO23_08595 [Alphaproteobacteria bacterium]|nr:hypothetical protein [Alphaproteobacteria bacterium]